MLALPLERYTALAAQLLRKSNGKLTLAFDGNFPCVTGSCRSRLHRQEISGTFYFDDFFHASCGSIRQSFKVVLFVYHANWTSDELPFHRILQQPWLSQLKGLPPSGIGLWCAGLPESNVTITSALTIADAVRPTATYDRVTVSEALVDCAVTSWLRTASVDWVDLRLITIFGDAGRLSPVGAADMFDHADALVESTLVPVGHLHIAWTMDRSHGLALAVTQTGSLVPTQPVGSDSAEARMPEDISLISVGRMHTGSALEWLGMANLSACSDDQVACTVIDTIGRVLLTPLAFRVASRVVGGCSFGRAREIDRLIEACISPASSMNAASRPISCENACFDAWNEVYYQCLHFQWASLLARTAVHRDAMIQIHQSCNRSPASSEAQLMANLKLNFDVNARTSLLLSSVDACLYSALVHDGWLPDHRFYANASRRVPLPAQSGTLTACLQRTAPMSGASPSLEPLSEVEYTLAPIRFTNLLLLVRPIASCCASSLPLTGAAPSLAIAQLDIMSIDQNASFLDIGLRPPAAVNNFVCELPAQELAALCILGSAVVTFTLFPLILRKRTAKIKTKVTRMRHRRKTPAGDSLHSKLSRSHDEIVKRFAASRLSAFWRLCRRNRSYDNAVIDFLCRSNRNLNRSLFRQEFDKHRLKLATMWISAVIRR